MIKSSEHPCGCAALAHVHEHAILFMHVHVQAARRWHTGRHVHAILCMSVCRLRGAGADGRPNPHEESTTSNCELDTWESQYGGRAGAPSILEQRGRAAGDVWEQNVEQHGGSRPWCAPDGSTERVIT